MAVAIIPARGGSKGIPGKNLQQVGGRTLVARTVDTALGCPSIDRVVVSTDADDIADEAAAHGATIVRRPAELAGDEASSESAILNALVAVDEGGPWFAFLQCTSPFLTPADLELIVTPVKDGQADVTFAAAEFHGHIWELDDHGDPFGVNHNPAAPVRRRQDRPSQLLETGAGYAIRTAQFLHTGRRFFGRIRPIVLDTLRAIDIDTPADLEAARALVPLLDRQAAG